MKDLQVGVLPFIKRLDVCVSVLSVFKLHHLSLWMPNFSIIFIARDAGLFSYESNPFSQQTLPFQTTPNEQEAKASVI